MMAPETRNVPAVLVCSMPLSKPCAYPSPFGSVMRTESVVGNPSEPAGPPAAAYCSANVVAIRPLVPAAVLTSQPACNCCTQAFVVGEQVPSPTGQPRSPRTQPPDVYALTSAVGTRNVPRALEWI